MKKTLFVIVLFCIVLFCSQRVFGADAKKDSSQFPLTVHISGSTYAPCYDIRLFDSIQEIVTATINGEHYQLIGPTSSAKAFVRGNGLINPGEYHAKLAEDKHKTTYESLQEFEILFPDGTTRRFSVIAQSE